MNLTNKYLYHLVLLMIICSCSPVSSSWSCKGNVKGRCKTIYELESDYNNTKNMKNAKEDFKQKTKLKLNDDDITNSSFDDFRSKESVARVVFSPYVDAAGNRHDVSTVYYLEHKAEWRK